MLGRAIQHAQLLDAAVAEMPHDLLAGCARADDQCAMSIQLAEDALGEFYAREGHRNGPRADLRLRSDALAHFESALKHAVEHGARCAVIERDPVGVAHLAQDFGFAQQHGVEPRRDAKQMAHRMAVPVPVERSIQFTGRKLVERCQEQFHRAGAVGREFAGNAVQFAAVAGRKHQRFFEDAARTQLFGGFASLFGAERDALAQRNRGCAVVQSDENNFHLRNARLTPLNLLRSRPLRNSGENARKIPVHDTVTENHKHEIEYAKRRSARAAPRGRSRQQGVPHVYRENHKRDDHFGIAVPIPALQPVRPDQSSRHSRQPATHNRSGHCCASSVREHRARESATQRSPVCGHADAGSV